MNSFEQAWRTQYLLQLSIALPIKRHKCSGYLLMAAYQISTDLRRKDVFIPQSPCTNTEVVPLRVPQGYNNFPASYFNVTTHYYLGLSASIVYLRTAVLVQCCYILILWSRAEHSPVVRSCGKVHKIIAHGLGWKSCTLPTIRLKTCLIPA